METCDPTHLNDAQILTQEMAAQYPRFKAGDLLVSFRTLNTIGVLDPETELFKWHFQGPSHHQHSPRFLGNDVIVFLDNLGGQVSRGTSRILAVNVDSSAFESVFPKAGTGAARKGVQDQERGVDRHQSSGRPNPGVLDPAGSGLGDRRPHAASCFGSSSTRTWSTAVPHA